MNAKTKQPLIMRLTEKGIISIMTAMILMVVISLIVLGFAQISRRNQRQTLDRQLSTQAFYAAESGINDARKIINTAVAAGNTIAAKDECGGTGSGGFYTGLNPDLDSSLNVKYTCLLIDPQPKSLHYSNIGTTTNIVPIISSDSTAISNITLNWQSKSTSATPLVGCPTTTDNIFTPAVSWACGYGVLRLDIVPTAGSSLTVDALRNNTMTLFMVPLASGSASTSVAYHTANNSDAKRGAQCTSTGCQLQITG